MSYFQRSKRISQEEVIGSLCRLGEQPMSPKSLMEPERRIRREIANSNERRRMQSINAGFQSLKHLLPHREGEKLSKAAILQNTADYIIQLEQERNQLLKEKQSAKMFFDSQNCNPNESAGQESPLQKRKKWETDSAEDDVDNRSSVINVDYSKREVLQLKVQLKHERAIRALLEEQIRSLESQLYSLDQRPVSKMPLKCHFGIEDKIKFAAGSGQESGLGSPQSQLSSQDEESGHEMSLQESSPEHSYPEDLSGTNHQTQASTEEKQNTKITTSYSSPAHAEVSSLSEQQHISQVYSNTCRSNLRTIVEAIRLVEGDHMFRDDPVPSKSESPVLKVETNSNEQYQQTVINVVPFHRQIIQSGPLAPPQTILYKNRC